MFKNYTQTDWIATVGVLFIIGAILFNWLDKDEGVDRNLEKVTAKELSIDSNNLILNHENGRLYRAITSNGEYYIEFNKNLTGISKTVKIKK